MGWFSRYKKKPENQMAEKKELWYVCPSCTAHIYREEWEKNLKVCSKCNFHERLTCWERIDMLIDEGTAVELNPSVTTTDPLNFSDAKGSYADKAKEVKENTGLKESVVAVSGQLKSRNVILAVMDFRFLGGSLGSGSGERILLAAEYALLRKRPFIIVSASGGARMHEGIVSLMQMAKTCAGISRLRKAGLPYISILTDPTMGGVSASYAMVGDLNIAEPGALVGFAGRRVIEQTIKQELPKDFQTAEYLVEHGFMDRIVSRTDMKEFLANIFKYWNK